MAWSTKTARSMARKLLREEGRAWKYLDDNAVEAIVAREVLQVALAQDGDTVKVAALQKLYDEMRAYIGLHGYRGLLASGVETPTPSQPLNAFENED